MLTWQKKNPPLLYILHKIRAQYLTIKFPREVKIVKAQAHLNLVFHTFKDYNFLAYSPV